MPEDNLSDDIRRALPRLGMHDLGTKQTSYARTLLRKVYAACGAGSGEILAEARRAGHAFDFDWFNEEYSSCPVALGCRKLNGDVNLGALVKRDFSRCEHFSSYQQSRLNFPGKAFALIFDRHGDTVGDLVMHDHPALAAVGQDWQFQFWHEGDLYFIQPLNVFLRSLGTCWRHFS